MLIFGIHRARDSLCTQIYPTELVYIVGVRCWYASMGLGVHLCMWCGCCEYRIRVYGCWTVLEYFNWPNTNTPIHLTRNSIIALNADWVKISSNPTCTRLYCCCCCCFSLLSVQTNTIPVQTRHGAVHHIDDDTRRHRARFCDATILRLRYPDLYWPWICVWLYIGICSCIHLWATAHRTTQIHTIVSSHFVVSIFFFLERSQHCWCCVSVIFHWICACIFNHHCFRVARVVVLGAYTRLYWCLAFIRLLLSLWCYQRNAMNISSWIYRWIYFENEHFVYRNYSKWAFFKENWRKEFT